MAKSRAIDQRRKAVNNIKKITHTMQLIATARYQKSLARAVASKPYTEKITEMVKQVSSAGSAADHPLLRTNDDVKRRALLLVTANRGMCGGYNANLCRNALATLKKNTDAGYETDLYVIGKKGVNYFRFLGYDLTQTYPDLPDAPQFAQIEPIADAFIRDYSDRRYESVSVVSMRFITASRQVPELIRLLPIRPETEPDATIKSTPQTTVQYDFSPEPGDLLAELLPVTVKIRLFQCISDAVVSENVARMVAMKSATDAAGDMSKLLSRQFNRARQSQITMELLDIMGGVEALK